jgi:hypothetical protein
VYALLSKSTVIIATASLTLLAGSGKVVTSGVTYAASLMYLQKKINERKVRQWPTERLTTYKNKFLWNCVI